MRTITFAAVMAAVPLTAHAVDIRDDRYTTAVMAPSWEKPWPKGEPPGYGLIERFRCVD